MLSKPGKQFRLDNDCTLANFSRLDQIAEQVGSVSKAVSEQPQMLPTIQSQQKEILEL